MKRYQYLLDLIDIFKPQTICEVGTWNGDNAIRMIKKASWHNTHIDYYGFDLFEEASEQTDIEEFNVKPHYSREEVYNKIKDSCSDAVVELIKGNTRETLKKITCDFVFIDGGHSLETIKNDYNAVKHSNIIILDDYYTPDEFGKMPNIDKVGCNRLVNDLPHAVIYTADRVEGGGIVNFALVCSQ